MIVVLGLLILVAAGIVAVAGVISNSGSGHALAHGFSVFGYHVTGSTGALFLYGVVVGAIALFGLSLLLTGARRTSRRGRAARRDLKGSRRQTATVSRQRDSLVDQRETARADSAHLRRHDSSTGDGQTAPDEGGHRHRLFGRRSGTLATAAPAHPDRPAGRDPVGTES
jgi:hypothetical protein